jgi:hypothetical protein
MSAVDMHAASGLMPDWNRHEADQIDRIDWESLVEFGKPREFAPRAAHTEEA